MPLDISTHASLLEKLRATGAESAWTTFDERYRELIFAFARRRGFQASDADDIAQETLAVVVGAIKRFEYDPALGRFRGWLKQTALHVMLKKLRPGADALTHGRAGLSSADDVPEDPETDAVFEIEWRRYHVRMATAKVRTEFNTTDFEAFERCSVNGDAAQEVASALKISVDSVYKAKSRILARLKDHIAAQVAEEG